MALLPDKNFTRNYRRILLVSMKYTSKSHAVNDENCQRKPMAGGREATCGSCTKVASGSGAAESMGSGLSAFTIAISSQQENFGQRKQSFQTLSGSSPRSTSRKPIFWKKPGT